MEDEFNTYRIISIDPGSQLVGFTLWEIDIPTLAIKMVSCWTEDVRHYEKTIPREMEAIELRLLGLRQVLKHVFKRFQPHGVCTESNFLQKHRVTGYRGLLLTLAAIREVMYEELPELELDVVHVIKAKEFMKAASNSKEDVHKQVVKIPDVEYPDGFEPSLVGPDGLDSIALGYCYIKSHWDQLRAAQYWSIK